MTQSEILQLRGTLALYAAYYRQQLPDAVVVMYAEDLADLDFATVSAALRAYRANPKNRTMPLPAQIREMLEPQVDPESAAREIAARITAAIPKFGWCNSQEARAYIGEVGWQVVLDQGGWMHICQHHGLEIDPSVFQAQARDLAKSRLVHNPQAMAKVIGLPSGGERKGELTAKNDFLALLGPQERA